MGHLNNVPKDIVAGQCIGYKSVSSPWAMASDGLVGQM